MTLDEKLQEISNLHKTDLNCNIFSVYDYDGATLTELLCQFFTKINECVDLSKSTLDLSKWLVNEGLSSEVALKLSNWVNDGTFDTIINQNIFTDLNNKIEGCKNDLQNTTTNLNDIVSEFKKDINSNIDNFSLNTSMGNLNVETSFIYPTDKISLAGTSTWSYYDDNQFPEYYPSVSMTKDGRLLFSGNVKIESPLILKDNMVFLGTLYHFSIESHEGIPMRGTFIGINDNDHNDTCEIPFIVKPNGQILIKNLGENSKYYTRIDLNGASVNLYCHGEQTIQNNINEVVKLAQEKGDIAKQFIYFTDIHHDIKNYRRYEQLKAMQKVDNLLNLTCFVSGGDNIQEQTTKKMAINCHKDLYGTFKKDKFVHANGNHDINIMNDSNLYVHPFNIKPFINNTKTVYGGDDKYYGYTDYEKDKIRFVCFDTHENNFNNSTPSAGAYVSDDQLEWIKNNAFDMRNKKDWNVIIVGHIPPVEKTTSDDTVLPNRAKIRSLVESFKNGTGDFESQGAIKLCAWLCGHEHKDRVVNINGISYVYSLLSWSAQVGYQEPNQVYQTITRPYGTDYEFAFDIVSVVDIERKVYFHRVGRKTNLGHRVISY